MHFFTLLSGLAALSSVAATERVCGSIPHRSFAQESKDAIASFSPDSYVAANITVDTYFHVITASQKGNLSKETIDKQLAVMNSAYGPAGINFKLMNVSRTENARWAAGMDEFSMKSTLRKGSYSALNIYFAPNLSGGLLGFCYFPKADLYPYDKIVDGCVIFSSTVPGGDRARFNEGKTATHEVGHYMGLYHVFNEKNGDCSKDGDMVDDTPIQGTKTSGCPAGKDSCPAPGLDSIHNFMDYSDDSCMTEFTPGQNARMQMMWQKFRAGK